MKTLTWLLIAGAVVFGIVAFIGSVGVKIEDECAAKGAVAVRGYSRTLCIDRSVIK